MVGLRKSGMVGFGRALFSNAKLFAGGQANIDSFNALTAKLDSATSSLTMTLNATMLTTMMEGCVRVRVRAVLDRGVVSAAMTGGIA